MNNQPLLEFQRTQKTNRMLETLLLTNGPSGSTSIMKEKRTSQYQIAIGGKLGCRKRIKFLLGGPCMLLHLNMPRGAGEANAH